jgi:hypothetical protein
MHQRFLFLFLASVILFTSGCVIIRAKTQTTEKCELVTRAYRLEISEKLTKKLIDDVSSGMFNDIERCQDIACVLISPFIKLVAIPVGSFVITGSVSGSVVVVGNTIHWIERQGKCDDSVTQRAFDSLARKSRSFGGKVIDGSADLIDWFKEKVRKKKDVQEEILHTT